MPLVACGRLREGIFGKLHSQLQVLILRSHAGRIKLPGILAVFWGLAENMSRSGYPEKILGGSRQNRRTIKARLSEICFSHSF